MTTLAGISVSRAIPESALIGLLSGAYSLHGGVVRDMGGRIVAHMAFPATAVSALPGLGWVADAFQTYQLHTMGLTLARVESQMGDLLKVSTATIALSGLGLAVSVGGFAFLSRKLNELSLTLRQIERNTQKANNFLQAIQYSQLEAAVTNLRHAIETTDNNIRQACLMASKNEFGKLVHQYPRLLTRFDDLEELQSLDDSYLIAMIGMAQATSDLGMGQVALDDFTTNRLTWQRVARELCKSNALKKEPQRLLHHRYLASMPAIDLIKLLDFVHQTQKGTGWVDELRMMESEASLLRFPNFGSEESELLFSRKLLARDDVIAGFESHLKFLIENNIRSCDFQAGVKELVNTHSGSDPCWIIQEERPQSNPKSEPPTPKLLEAQVTWLGRIKSMLGFGGASSPT